MSLIHPLIPTDLSPALDANAPLRFVEAWGAIPSEPLLHPPSLRLPLQEALEGGLLEERPTPFGYTLVLSRSGFLALSRAPNSAIPNERSRTYRLLGYLVGASLKGRWPYLTRCRSMVYVLRDTSGRTALLFLLASGPSPRFWRMIHDRYLCGGSTRKHSSFFFFSPRGDQRQLPEHIIQIKPPELSLWLRRLRKRVERLYGAG